MARTIGIDTGGTFTDLVALERGEPVVAKTPSIPADPARALLDALALVGGARRGERVVHGTTVALNALLTGALARVALVTNAGFEDLLEIGRQERPHIYALHPAKPAPLVERRLRFGVAERSWPDPAGEGVLRVERAGRAELARLARRLAASGAESVAVCLLHAWADPSVERELAGRLRACGLPTTCSAELLREHREVERFSTAVVNAALVPRMRAYLGSLAERLAPARLELLQSSGGTIDAARAADEPVRVLFSGPAGGVVGAAAAAFEAGLEDFVAIDVGGTSTDVAFHEVGAQAARRPVEPLRVAGHPVAVPSLDIHTIGCGGGSLVELDAGGALHVGPESAGADPGPMAYGKSERLTLTDAHLLLGHIASGRFLGGALALDEARVARAFEALGKRAGARPAAAAQAVLEVARAGVRRALGVMTMERGQDPRRLPLVAFGGGGGLHAAALAASLGMRAALVPRHPGALSARGLCAARPLADAERAVLEPLERWPAARRRAAQRALAREARARLAAGGTRAGGRVLLEHALDLRYRGQSFEIAVPDAGDAQERFHRAHEALYGYRLERPIELVCLRARALVREARERPTRPRARRLPAEAVLGERRVWLGRSVPVRARVIDRDALSPGCAFEGPAVIEEYSGTTLLPPGWRASVTAGGHLLLQA